jgi:hypothetical protein
MTRIALSGPVTRTPRVMQVEAMFDVPSASQSARMWDIGLPLDEQPWQIGLIVGPSGSGKPTIARHFWPQTSHRLEWADDKVIIDGFPDEMPTGEITSLLNCERLGQGVVPALAGPPDREFDLAVVGEGGVGGRGVLPSMIGHPSGDEPLMVDEKAGQAQITRASRRGHTAGTRAQ